jgi:single-strand DNA-binding protein
MPDLMTITGIVATTPRHIVTNSGLDITSFRLASGQRRFDRDLRKWVDAETNWYTVTAFRQLALNVAASATLGQRVLVSGRLRVRAWESGDKTGTTVELEADAVGHDLSWGTSVYTKSLSPSPAPSATDADAFPPGEGVDTHDGATENPHAGLLESDGSEPTQADVELLPF